MEVEFVSTDYDLDEDSSLIIDVHPDDFINSDEEFESESIIIDEEDFESMSVAVNPPSSIAIESSVSDLEFMSILSEKNLFKLERKKATKTNMLPPVCHICKKTFSCAFTKRIHLRTVHTDERPFLCNFCSSRFKRKDHLQKHILILHENTRASAPAAQTKKYVPMKYLCAQCGKIFCNKTTYQQHVDSVHSEVKKYHCEPCNKSFNRYSKLYRHKVVLNHGKNQFLKSCTFCGLEFSSEIYYIRHMTKHEEARFCEKCDIEFDTNQNFKNHVSDVHFDKKELACDVCGKKYGNKTSLVLHKRSHELNDKPFQCEHCDWRFKNKGHLVVHMYRHTGERPYKCSICNKGFKQKGDMRKHKAGHLFNQKKNNSFLEDSNVKTE